jgi:hypothetical protein
VTDYRSTGSDLILSVLLGRVNVLSLIYIGVFYVVFTYSLEF